MKRIHVEPKLIMLLVAVCLAAGTALALAADKVVTGLGKCAKEHQTAIEVKENGQTVTYYLVQNAASKDFHSKICSKPAQVRASGEVREVNGRWEMAANKIELLLLQDQGRE